MMKSCIYTVNNSATGKFYLGRTINSKSRFVAHISALRRGNHANLHLQSSFATHGESAFVFNVLWEESADNLEELEQFLLEELFPTGNLYNISKSANGGDREAACADARAKAVATRRANGHKPFSDASRQKKKDDAKARLSMALDWAVANSATREEALSKFGCSWGSLKLHQTEWESAHGPLVLSKKASGKKNGLYKHGLSSEIKRKRTPEELAEKNTKQSARMRGANNPMFGRKHSEEARRIQSDAAKKQAELRKESGYVVSDEIRAKRSAAMKGKPKSLEHKRSYAMAQLGKMYKTPSGIFCTSKEAEAATGIKAATIMWRCKNNYQGEWTYSPVA